LQYINTSKIFKLEDSIRLVKDRHELCFKVPILLLVYIVFLVLFVLRADISNSFDFEEGLLACTGLSGDNFLIVRDSGIATQNLGSTVYTWLQNTLLPRIFHEVTNDNSSVKTKLAVSCGAASASSINVASVGGVRLSQWRRSARNQCKLGKESLGPFLGSSEFEFLCHSSHEALDPTLVPFFGLLDVANEFNLSEAFSPLSEELRLKLTEGSRSELSKNEITLAARAQAATPLPPLALGFHSTFSPALLELAAVLSRIDGLRESRWIDDNTLDIEVGAAFLNRENSRIALLRVDFHSTVGMRLDVSTELRSLPVDPYKQFPSLPLADAFFILFSITLTGSWLYNTTLLFPKIFSKIKNEVPKPPLSSITPPERDVQVLDAYAVEGRVDVLQVVTAYGGGSSKVSQLQITELFFWILHGGSTISLIALMILWSLLISELSITRNILVQGKWESSSGNTFDTLLLHQSLAKASLLQSDVLLCGISMIIFLTLTILYLFRLQPHLAILGKCIWKGLSDIIHLAFVLAVITTAYGVIGHVAFGAQSSEWSSVRTSAWTLSRMFIAWDYSLAPMQIANPALANAFVGTFMFLIANMMVWVWFTIIIETYSLAKVALKEGGDNVPSVFGDILSGFNTAKNVLLSLFVETRTNSDNSQVSENNQASSGVFYAVNRIYKTWIQDLHAHNRFLEACEAEAVLGDLNSTTNLPERIASRLTDGKGCGDQQDDFIKLIKIIIGEYTSCGDSSLNKPCLRDHLVSIIEILERQSK
jgi:hypothetical protein